MLRVGVVDTSIDDHVVVENVDLFCCYMHSDNIVIIIIINITIAAIASHS